MTELPKFGRTDEALAALRPALADGTFAGKIVLVSGAGSGIGRATAHFFARLGAHVILAGRTEDKLITAQAAIPTSTDTHALSIRDPQAVSDLFDAIYAKHGRLDILVNSAGGQFPQAAIDFSVKGWNAVIDTNLNGTWYMMQVAARHWRDAAQPGVIVNVVTAISRGMPGVAHSCAARAGVIYASKTVAVEWAPLNIRVNCISPGVIATEGMNVYPPEVQRQFSQTNPQKRFGQVEDIANAITYLASPAASFITGEVLTIDGGNQMWGDQWTIPRPDYFAVS
jgi:citronellol/citronellal dehydrogenase